MRLCATEQVDIIQCHLSDAEFLGIAAGALCRINKIITTVHGPLPLLPPRPVWSLRNYLRRCVTKILYRWTDHVVAVSDEVAREIHALFAVTHSKIRTVINRIDTQSYAHVPVPEQVKISLGLRPEQRVITTVARFAPHKGHACLIDAVHALKQQHDGIRLFLVGDGECREELEKKCSNRGIRDSVSFLGNRGDIPVILALTEIFVFPTYAEGTSLALMEAMAAGKPIVATNIPGNAALLEHRKSALLVPPGDAHAMKEAILFLLEHPAIARAYGHEARSVITGRFDIRETIAELEQLWGNTL
jgi:glycosyltransferase involved in cell wall biosynthesis